MTTRKKTDLVSQPLQIIDRQAETRVSARFTRRPTKKVGGILCFLVFILSQGGGDCNRR